MKLVQSNERDRILIDNLIQRDTFGIALSVQSVKQRHFWIWSSSPNKGKSTFLNSVEQSFPSLRFGYEEIYQQHLPYSQFVLLDEFSHSKLVGLTKLNSMCDGTYQYPVKGASSFKLTDPIILVCGNSDPLFLFPESLHPLIQARFTIINLD